MEHMAQVGKQEPRDVEAQGKTNPSFLVSVVKIYRH